MRRIKTAVGFIYYNDLESIKRSIPSFIDHFDYVIAVDGRFSMRVGEDYSSDGSTEYLQQFDNVILKKFVGMEPEKRNIYLNEAKKLNIDALLMIDTDEYIVEEKDEGGWDAYHKFIKNTVINTEFPMWSVRYADNDPNPKAKSYARLYTHLEILNYAECHCVFKINGHMIHIACDSSRFTITGISIEANDTLRDKTWINLTHQYQRKLLVLEKPVKKKSKYMIESEQHLTGNMAISRKDVMKSPPIPSIPI